MNNGLSFLLEKNIIFNNLRKHIEKKLLFLTNFLLCDIISLRFIFKNQKKYKDVIFFMSSKLVASHKNNMCNVGQISLISKFYMKLPEEVIDFAINQLSRDVKRKVKKEKRAEGKIIMALNMSASTFADAVYNYQRSGMIFSEDTEYEKILASYNSEN